MKLHNNLTISVNYILYSLQAHLITTDQDRPIHKILKHLCQFKYESMNDLNIY